MRMKWLKKLRHHKVKLAIASVAGRVSVDGAAPAQPMQSATSSKGALRPFPIKRGKGGKSRAEQEMEDDNMAVDIEADHNSAGMCCILHC